MIASLHLERVFFANPDFFKAQSHPASFSSDSYWRSGAAKDCTLFLPESKVMPRFGFGAWDNDVSAHVCGGYAPSGPAPKVVVLGTGRSTTAD